MLYIRSINKNTMKNLITLLIVLLSISGYSQSNLDMLVFNKINEYRESKGLVSLIWDNKTFNASKHHTKYLVKNKVVGHTEKNNTMLGKNYTYGGVSCIKDDNLIYSTLNVYGYTN